jgi:chorismate lyase
LPNKSLLLTVEPTWRENRPGLRHFIPASVASWVFEPGSLTRRLRGYYGNSVKVNVIYQRQLTPFLSESRILNQPNHRFCLTREVLLHADNIPLILARTIIPEQTVRSAHRNLSHLGSRPLGEVIFSYPGLERLQLQVTIVDQAFWTTQALKLGDIKEPVWGRRTIYAIKQKPLLVNEFFLPGALAIA